MICRICRNCQTEFEPAHKSDYHCPDCAHAATRRMGIRANAEIDTPWRKSKKFARMRLGFLSAKENHKCAKCGKRAYVLDHIRPHRGDYELFWDKSNWQALCKKCHDAKTHREDT